MIISKLLNVKEIHCNNCLTFEIANSCKIIRKIEMKFL